MPGAYKITVYNKDGSEELLASTWGDFGIIVQSDRLLWNGTDMADYNYVLFSNTDVIGYATTSNATVAEYPIGAEYVPSFGTTLTLYEVERDPYNITFYKNQLIVKCKDKTMEKDLQISFGGEKVRSIKLLLDATKSCDNLFYNYTGSTIPDGTLEFSDTSNVEKMSSMYSGSKYLKNVPLIDTSNVTDMNAMHDNCQNLLYAPEYNTSNVNSCGNWYRNCLNIEILPYYNTSKMTSFRYNFYNCKKLKTVTYLDLISATSSSSLGSMFDYCANLTNITLLNIQVDLQIGSGTSWGHLLTIDSLVNTCKECIKQSASRTLTVGSANLTKLSSVYVKFTNPLQTEIAVGEKGDIVVCESTDAGAMLIADYMQLKSWALA